MTSYQLESALLGHFVASGRVVAEALCMSGHTGAGGAPGTVHGTSSMLLQSTSTLSLTSLPSETARSLVPLAPCRISSAFSQERRPWRVQRRVYSEWLGLNGAGAD
jgi:hypothetical protein